MFPILRKRKRHDSDQITNVNCMKWTTFPGLFTLLLGEEGTINIVVHIVHRSFCLGGLRVCGQPMWHTFDYSSEEPIQPNNDDPYCCFPCS